MRITPLLACVLVLAAGCRDDGTGPSENRAASIRLSQTAAPLDDGATLQLTAEPLDRGGRALPAGTVRLAWSTSDEAIATVADGLVTGRRPGEAKITATAGSASASAQVTVRPVPQALGAVSGAAQEGVAGMPAPQEIVVLLTDRHGGGVPGVAVEFVAVQGGGTVSPASAQTDEKGRARAAWTFGRAAGVNAVEARVVGRSLAPAVFAATAKAGAPARLEKLAGDAQQGAAASQLPLPLVVRVTDANGNPVAGASVAWRCSYGGSAAPAVSVTDVSGEARATWLLGPGAGAQAVEARVEGSEAAAVQFSANAGVGAAARLEMVSGDNQEATVTRPLPEPIVVRVVDAPGNPLPGIKISWKLFYGGGTVAPPESMTDAQGYARATWTLGTIMAHHRLEVRAVEPALPPVTFTALARVGPAASVAAFRGDGGGVPVGTTLRVELVARVTDAHGNPVPGAPVAWSGGSRLGGFSLTEAATDTLGLARALWAPGTVAGQDEAVASAAGAAARFRVRALPGPAATMRIVPPPSEQQPAGLRVPLAGGLPLGVAAKDAFGNDVVGPAVAWSSSRPEVAAVSTEGMVAGVARGLAVVRAESGHASDTVAVEVDTWRRYRATDLGARFVPADLNDGGQVVGKVVAPEGSYAALWDDGRLVEIGKSLPRPSEATAINESGEVAGSYPLPLPPPSEHLKASVAFRWQAGRVTTLPNRCYYTLMFNSACTRTAVDIDERGDVLTQEGLVWSYADTLVLFTSQAYNPWWNLRAVGITDDGRVAATWSQPAPGFPGTPTSHPVWWTRTDTTGFLDDEASYPTDVSGQGWVVGNSSRGGWLFRNGAVSWISGHRAAPGRNSTVIAVNGRGQVLADAGGYFVWENGRASYVDVVDSPGPLEGLTEINNEGQIVGVIRVDGQWRGVLLTPVP
jgi:hypothetical protein